MSAINRVNDILHHGVVRFAHLPQVGVRRIFKERHGELIPAQEYGVRIVLLSRKTRSEVVQGLL